MTISRHIQILVLVLFPAYSMGMDQSCSDQPLKAKLDEYLTACAEHLQFNGTVLVAKGDKMLVNKAFGMANFEASIPCTTQTRFILASVTKQFTAMSIMLLVQKGLLNVDDPIAKFMPGDLVLGDPRAMAITIQHCLTHSSGIKDFESLAEWKYGASYNSASEIIKLFKDKSLDFEPGSQFRYSNSGYIVLGYIVEQISGQSLANFMMENIFQPLNMQDTGFDYNAADQRFAFGYTNVKKHINYYDMSFSYGDGNLISTTYDLYLWSRALSEERLLRSDLSKELFTPHIKTADKIAEDPVYYGYGWSIAKVFGGKLILHTGSTPGFGTGIYRFVDDDVTIIVLSNIDPFISPAYAVINNLAIIMFNQEYELPKANMDIKQIAPDKKAQFVGIYHNEELDNMVIEMSESDLTATITKCSLTYELEFLDEDTARAGIGGFIIHLKRSKDELPESIVVEINGDEYEFVKL